MKKRICITIDPTLLAKAKKQAKNECRTLTSLVEVSVLNYLKRKSENE